MKTSATAVLLACSLALPGTLQAKERAPYLEAAFGLGFFTLNATLDGGANQVDDFGTLVMGDLKLFPLASYGVGLRLSGLSGASLFGGPSSGAFAADVSFATRPAPADGFHPVASLALGPSYFGYSSASEGCEPICEEPHLDSHHAVGGMLGLALDFHGGSPFGGLEVNGRYLFPVSSNAEREWMIQVLARFGGTFQLKHRG